MSRDLLLAALLVTAGCSSGPEKQPDPPPKDTRPPEKDTPKDPKTASPPAKTDPKTAPAKTDPPSNGGGGGDAVARATTKGWERGRIALVSDLIVKSKSFDRGFESALIFIPEMREGITAALIEQAPSRDGRVSERSLEALGAMAHLRLIPDGQRKQAIETVTKIVRNDRAPASWAAAVHALGSLSGHDAGQDVTAALGRAVDEDCPPVIRASAEVLGDLQFHEAAPALITALNRAHDRYAARTLVRALGRLGGKDATKRLVDALNGPDVADREAAASALGEAGGAEAANALRASIERPDEAAVVKRAAIAARERMGGEEATNALKACLANLSGRKEEAWVVINRDLSETLERLQRK